MLTQPIIMAPPRLTHVHSRKGKMSLVNDFFPAGKERSEVCFPAGVCVTSSAIAGANRTVQEDHSIREGEYDWYSLAPTFLRL